MAKSQNKPTKKDSEKLYVKYNMRFQQDCKKWQAQNIKCKSGTPEERIANRKLRDDMLKSIMKSYDIPERTFRTQIKKQFPGKRKPNKNKGKETVKLPKNVDKIVTESMLAGKNKGDAVKVAEKKTGVKISAYKSLKIKTDVKIDESSFGVKMKETVGAVWELDNIAPGAYIPIDVISKGKKFNFALHYETIKNIQLHITNDFNKCVEDRYKIIADNEQIREIMVGELFEEQIRIARESGDIKTVQALVNMQGKLKIRETILTPNFNVAFKSAQIFKPDLTKGEFIAAIRLVSKGESENG